MHMFDKLQFIITIFRFYYFLKVKSVNFYLINIKQINKRITSVLIALGLLKASCNYAYTVVQWWSKAP